MFVLAVAFELRLPNSHSLKEKRGVLKPLITLLRQRFGVSVAEVGHQDTWQRSTLGLATVGSSEHQAVEAIDAVERLVWSRVDLEVLSAERTWLELD